MDVGCFESEWLAALHPEAQHAWTRLLLHVKGVGINGSAKRLGPNAVVKAWGITALRLQEMEAAALGDGALRVEDGWWVVTGWDKYQQPDRTNSLRQKRFREKAVTPLSPVTRRYPPVTRHATETLTVTETKETSTSAVEVEFQKAWDSFPKRSGGNPRKLALEAFCARVKEGIDPEALIEATGRYRLFCDEGGVSDSKFIMQGATFFGPKERWKDEYHTNGNGHHHKGAPRVAADGRTIL